MSPLEAATDDELAIIMLSALLSSDLATSIGAHRLPRVLMAGALKLATDLDGPAVALVQLRDMLATVTEAARLAGYPPPHLAPA